MYNKQLASTAFDMRVAGYNDSDIAEFLGISSFYVRKLITMLCNRERIK